jgi:hypothetical protein
MNGQGRQAIPRYGYRMFDEPAFVSLSRSGMDAEYVWKLGEITPYRRDHISADGVTRGPVCVYVGPNGSDGLSLCWS